MRKYERDSENARQLGGSINAILLIVGITMVLYDTYPTQMKIVGVIVGVSVVLAWVLGWLERRHSDKSS